MLNAVADMRRVTMPMLRARLETRAREEFWRSYTANRLWEITQGLFGGQSGVKAYSEIMSEIDAKKAPQPTESAEDIKESILSKLRGDIK